jgi:hypothetical protein
MTAGFTDEPPGALAGKDAGPAVRTVVFVRKSKMSLIDLLRRSGPRCAPNPSRARARYSVELLESRLSPAVLTSPAPTVTVVISPTAVISTANQQNLTGWDVYPPSPASPGVPQGQAVPGGDTPAGQRLYGAATMDSAGAAPGSFWEAYAQPTAPPVAAPLQGLVVKAASPRAQ